MSDEMYRNTLYRRLALLTDDEVERCLHFVIGRLAYQEQKYNEILRSTSDLQDVVQDVAASVEDPLPKVHEVDPADRPKAARIILTEVADDSALRPTLEKWFESRSVLVDPITGAVVLAGIVVLLSTHVDIEFEQRDGERKIKVKIVKKPTSRRIIEKFFEFFQP